MDVSLGVFPERFNREGKSRHECGQHHPITKQKRISELNTSIHGSVPDWTSSMTS